MTAMLLTTLTTLDALLAQHAEAIGPAMPAYRNHCYRMANFCVALSEQSAETLEKIQIAAAFHDIGVWADRTFDYLDPSERRALAHLDAIGKPQWKAEIGEMIQQHHKVTALKPEAGALVEAFRKADWIDVLHGAYSGGIAPGFRREVFSRYPDAGFHWLLVKESTKRLVTHPWSPLPIFRW